MDWKDMLGQLRENLPDDGMPQDTASTGEPGQQTGAPGKEINSSKVQKEALRVLIDKKGRKGKTATIVEGFTLSDEEVARIAASLKRRLGTGGSARGGEILIQGDAADKVKALLQSDGFKVK